MMTPIKIATAHLKDVLSTDAEKEVERFLKKALPGTKWEGKIKAVGGYVRDEFMSKIKNDPSIEAKDLDLVVVEVKNGAKKATRFIYNMFKQPIFQRIFFPKEHPVSKPRQMGKGYPIWQITFKDDIKYKEEIYRTKGAVIEFADTMTEEYPDPQSRQRVTRPGTLEEDIKRRDLTVNMLLKDMTTGEVEDLTGQSKDDIRQGILRGHPEVSMDKTFEEDALRMIRLCRFFAKYGWEIPLSVLNSVKRNAYRIETVSSERIMGELEKVMKIGKLDQAVKLMGITGLLKYVLPEVDALRGQKQNPKYHSEKDVFTHTLMVLKGTAPGVEAQMAALLHDVGKPATTVLIEGVLKSKGHEDVGATIAEAIMKRLKFDNTTTDKVKKMVKNHMRPHDLIGSSAKAVRKFIRDVGNEMVDAILNLAEADELGRIPSSHDIPDLRKRINEIRTKEEVKVEPVLDGKEIMALLGLATGTEVGRAKKMLLDIGDEYFEQGKTLTKEDAKKELLDKFKKEGAKKMASRITTNFLK